MSVRSWFFGRSTRQQNLIFGSLLGLALAIGIAIALQPQESAIASALSWQAWLAIAVTIAAFLGNAFTTLPADIVFLGAAAILFLSGVLDEKAALSGFSNSGMITVGVLYIVVAGLQQTGALQWVSQQVLGMPKTPSRALVRLMLPVMGASAFLNNTPVVAMFIPVVNDWCRKLRFSPSKLMIPLSYAAIFGGLFSLIGTSTNLVVNGLLVDAEGSGLKFFDIAGVGLPCGIAGFLFLFFTQKWLLPNRQAAISGTDELRQYTVDMAVMPESPLVGKTVEQAGLRHLPNLYLAAIDRDAQTISAVGPQTRLQGNDHLRFVGVVDSILDLQRIKGLQPATDEVFKLEGARKERSLIEAVVSNTCPIVGQTIRESQFRTRYNAVVVAAARNGDRLTGKIGDIRIQPGDTLLLEAAADFIGKRRISRDFYLVSSIPNSEPIRHERSRIAFILTLIMVVAAAFGWLTMLQAAVLAAVGMIAFGCCSPNQALRSIDWPVLMVIAAALALGQALDSTGAAEEIANKVIALAGNNPLWVLAAIYAVTTVLTEIITNNAAAALVFPIALSLANQLGVSSLPFVIAIMVAAAASFATPIGYQTNLMVCGPGGYKFSDFMRIGIPLNILYGVMTVAIAPFLYPF
ncbi:MAG: SLC13 family permease [Leptolyngbya foveolarum]|uniref:SLC13 family permease n=1 Tax=Leptolyngbya foveolarum TaxID=47253 RepID=A0A2W4USS0_9CYAN|nr:MAG: SLC13 family permease [Leptolyngbya foveolarum]